MANKVNTRIVLKNDTLENWLSSSSIDLKQGELAFAKVGDKYELRIGQGGKYSAAAQLQLSASQIVGLDAGNLHTPQIYKIENADTTKPVDEMIASDAELSTKEFGPGDVFIAFNSDGVASAYHYDAEDGWIACEGNVDASKVIVTKDIDLAGSYDRVGNLEVGGKVTKGTSVAKMFEDILDKTLSATLSSDPTASITLTNSGAKEIGSDITPSWSVSYTQGKYYQEWNDSLVDDGTAATAYSITDGTSTSDKSSGTFTKFTVKPDTNYKVTGTVTYSDGDAAVTNKGDETSLKRTSATIDASASAAITGAYPAYFAFTTGDVEPPTTINANDGTILKIDNVVFYRALNDFSKTTFATSNKWYKLFYIIPTGKHTSWSGTDNTTKLPVASKATKVKYTTVTFLDGTTAEYDVFWVANANPADATTCVMKYA